MRTADAFFTAIGASDEGGERVDARALSKLRWRCRRGLLENDLFVARFFARHEHTLTVRQAAALSDLMDLSDPDLLDLLLARTSLESLVPLNAALDRPAVRELLILLKEP